MFPLKALPFCLTLVSLSVVGATSVTRSTGKAVLRFSTKFNDDGPLSIVEKDRARAKAREKKVGLLSGPSAGEDVSVVNNAVAYTAQVGVGDPATEYTLVVDTGSSITWVGANQPYVPTSSSHDTGNTFSVTYGSAQISGEMYVDTVTLGSDLVISSQSIGVVNSVAGFPHYDGILGLGPPDLSEGMISNTNMVPTEMGNLFTGGQISEEVLGIYFIPDSESSPGGELTFGGVDYSVITGPVQYVPLTTTSPASQYWGINQSITYGDIMIMPETPGVVDTGSTLILVPTGVFNAYKSATGGTLDQATDMLMISPSQYNDLQTLSFIICGMPHNLSRNAQIWPRSLNTAIGGSSEGIYLVVSDIGAASVSGIDLVIGYAFLERYYTVLDGTNKQIGFATTAYTESNTN